MAGLGVGYALLRRDLQLPAGLNWLIAVPVALASYSVIAGLLGVCASSGFRGQRFADHGVEAVIDARTRRMLKMRALMVVSLSLLMAGLFAFAFVRHA
jgi:hypothetical protein